MLTFCIAHIGHALPSLYVRMGRKRVIHLKARPGGHFKQTPLFVEKGVVIRTNKISPVCIDSLLTVRADRKIYPTRDK